MSYSSEVLSDSPLGYWRMGDASGTAMTDSSPNARHGSYINGPTLGVAGLLVGDPDTAVDFASSKYALAPDDGSLDNLSAFTIEAIIKPASTSGTPMIAARDDTTTAGRSFQFYLSGGKLAFTKIANGVVTATGATTLSAGSTYHVAATYDGATIRVYVNGIQDGTAAATGTLGTSSTDLRIGARRNTTPITTDFFTGTVDEVAAYNAALSSVRLAAHHTAAVTDPTVSGTFGATFPAFTTDLDGHAAQQFEVDFPSFRASISGEVTQAGEVAVTFPPLEADLAGILPDVAAGDLLVTFPSFRLNVAGQLDEAISTDTSNDWNARVREGRGLVETEVAVEPMPANLVRAVRVEKAIAYPTPDLVDGRPT